MTTPHKHADFIKAWADGAEIEFDLGGGKWHVVSTPEWSSDIQYRIKPEPKPDVVQYCQARFRYGEYSVGNLTADPFPGDNLKLTFDGETGKLLKAEVIGEDTTL